MYIFDIHFSNTYNPWANGRVKLCTFFYIDKINSLLIRSIYYIKKLSLTSEILIQPLIFQILFLFIFN